MALKPEAEDMSAVIVPGVALGLAPFFLAPIAAIAALRPIAIKLKEERDARVKVARGDQPDL